MTQILSAVSPSVFSWSMLGRRSSAAFLLPRGEKSVWWPTPCRTHPVRVAAVALKLTDFVSISWNAATGRATWRHLSSSPVADVASLVRLSCCVMISLIGNISAFRLMSHCMNMVDCIFWICPSVSLLVMCVYTFPSLCLVRLSFSERKWL